MYLHTCTNMHLHKHMLKNPPSCWTYLSYHFIEFLYFPWIMFSVIALRIWWIISQNWTMSQGTWLSALLLWVFPSMHQKVWSQVNWKGKDNQFFLQWYTTGSVTGEALKCVRQSAVFHSLAETAVPTVTSFWDDRITIGHERRVN
jgi:hypothetical protein